jgi:hypothetical protein
MDVQELVRLSLRSYAYVLLYPMRTSLSHGEIAFWESLHFRIGAER